MATIVKQWILGRVYCNLCQKTLQIPLVYDLTESNQENLYSYTYIHRKKETNFPHALSVILDRNLAIRRSDNPELRLESFISSLDFNVQAYCRICQRNIPIPINSQSFEKAIDEKGYFKQVYIHDQPFHALITILDREKAVVFANPSQLYDGTGDL